MRISDWSSDVCSSDLDTHSLLGAMLWGLLFGAAVWFATRRREAAIGAGLVVLSHWLLDLAVHIPDLTLFGAPPRLGFGLWNHPEIEMPLEIGQIGRASCRERVCQYV